MYSVPIPHIEEQRNYYTWLVAGIVGLISCFQQKYYDQASACYLQCKFKSNNTVQPGGVAECTMFVKLELMWQCNNDWTKKNILLSQFVPYLLCSEGLAEDMKTFGADLLWRSVAFDLFPLLLM